MSTLAASRAKNDYRIMLEERRVTERRILENPACHGRMVQWMDTTNKDIIRAAVTVLVRDGSIEKIVFEPDTLNGGMSVHSRHLKLADVWALMMQ
jgi:hypothetical protein